MNLFEQHIREMVSECISDVILENAIRGMVQEAFLNEKKNKAKKGSKKSKSAKSTDKWNAKTKKNRKSTQYGHELAKDAVNQTAIVRADHPDWKDSTVRSYASKLARGERVADSDEATKGLHRLHATFA